MSDGFTIEPGASYSLSGVSGGEVDAIYTGPDGERIERNVPMPYTTTAREGETHVQFVVRATEKP